MAADHTAFICENCGCYNPSLFHPGSMPAAGALTEAQMREEFERRWDEILLAGYNTVMVKESVYTGFKFVILKAQETARNQGEV